MFLAESNSIAFALTAAAAVYGASEQFILLNFGTSFCFHTQEVFSANPK